TQGKELLMLQEIKILKNDRDAEGQDLLAEIKRLSLGSVSQVKVVDVYYLEGLSYREAEIVGHCLTDIDEQYLHGKKALLGASHTLIVRRQPGVMNPVSASLVKIALDLGFTSVKEAGTAKELHFFGGSKKQVMEIATRLLVNESVDEIATSKPKTLKLEL